MKELERLVQCVLEKRISYDEAGRKAVEFIYRNKKWFGLNRLSEDALHDFLLANYKMFANLFRNFDSSKGDFTCYLMGNVIQAYHGWKRENAKRFIKKMTLEEIEALRLRTEDPCELSEPSLYVCDSLSIFENASEQKKSQTTTYHKKTGIYGRNAEKEDPRAISMQETVLVLMVKSWYLIEPFLLKKISLFTSLPTEALIEILDKTKRMMSDKTEKFNQIEENINTSYYYMQRYRIANNVSYSMNLSQLINRKHKFHCGKWKRYTEELRVQNKKLIPSNRITGIILGIDQRRVQYILEKASKNMDILSLNCYYGRHEDLLSKRKLE